MSLNNISLPSQLIADLYQNVLLQDTASAVPVKKDLPFLGKNGKNILIVVDKADAPFLPDHELTFLANVLAACQLGLMDVAIVNWHNVTGHTANDLFAQLNSKRVILFDIAPSVVGLSNDLQPYTVTNMNSRQFVVAPSLTQIEKNKEAKKQLWIALKQLFGI